MTSLFPSGTVFPGLGVFPGVAYSSGTTTGNPTTTVFPSSIAANNPGGGLLAQISDLVLTGTDGAGVEWSVESPLSGWDSSPASSMSLTQKTRAAGAWPSPPQLTARTVALNGKIFSPDPDTHQGAIDRLMAAVPLSDTLLTVTRGLSTRSLIVRRQDEVVTQDVTDVLSDWSIQVVALDPRKFAGALIGSTELPSLAGGLTIPFTVPVAIVSTAVTGQVSLTNPGTAVGPVLLRIDGPIVGPQITHVGSGAQLTFSSSLSLGAGEWLEVDMEARTALANGQSSRNGWITQRGWAGADPGSNTWAFTALSGSGVLTVAAVPAWL